MRNVEHVYNSRGKIEWEVKIHRTEHSESEGSRPQETTRPRKQGIRQL